jgi:hypothetical protein
LFFLGAPIGRGVHQLLPGEAVDFATMRALSVIMVPSFSKHRVQSCVNGFAVDGEWSSTLLASGLHVDLLSVIKVYCNYPIKDRERVGYE